MDLKLSRGQYVSTASGQLESVQGAEEILQRVLMRLTVNQGVFLPDPDYGSRLYTLCRLKPSQRPAAAKLFVAEALASELAVQVDDVSYTPAADDTGIVSVALSLGGQKAEISVKV